MSSRFPQTLPRHALAYLGLFLIVLILYGRTLGFDFVSYDDQTYIVKNTFLHPGLTWDTVRWAGITFHFANWHPLTWISYLLDFEMFGLHAGGYHGTNLILHGIGTILLFRLLEAYTGAWWRSLGVAVLFAIHPLHVESVAWISERKDVLSGVFFFAAVIAYRSYALAPSWHRYVPVVGWFALGLMSKAMVVTLPCVLLLLDVWPLKRAEPRHIIRLMVEKLPLFALGAGASLLTILAQKAGGALRPVDTVSFLPRLSNALVSYGTYLWKTIFPTRLAVFYPYPETLSWWKTGAAAACLLTVTVICLWRRKEQPYFLFGWLWFLGMLVPVIGMVQVGDQAMADRYSYLPSIGLFVAAVWGSADLANFSPSRRFPQAMAGIILALLGGVAWYQIGIWRNSLTLFTHACRVTERNWNAHTNCGMAQEALGNYEAALVHYRTALQFNPHYAQAQYNIGVVLQSQNRIDDAIEQYRITLKQSPRSPDAANNLGLCLNAKGRPEEALPYFLELVQRVPTNPDFHYNLGITRFKLNDPDNARASFAEAARLKPDWASAHKNLGVCLRRLGHSTEALAAMRRALNLAPSDETIWFSLGSLLLEMNDPSRATVCFQHVLRLNPRFAPARDKLAELGTSSSLPS